MFCRSLAPSGAKARRCYPACDSSTVAGSQPIVHLPMVRLTIEQQVRGSILALLGHIAIFLETGGILPYFLEPGGFVLLRNHFVIT